MVQFSKIRLSGFKSFVDHTELVIPPGITGIVGPNGCGKSNLVEALRWAMGENSAKRMRGKEMDDVIFAGSANRPSRNVADVTLVLDNRKRAAPAAFNDFEELEVTRRIERGSGSIYRVNGREVRARDVQLLFADSATGSQSTALVSQGRVGAIINAKPVDRRALLEEAAGITGLHSRRHEAELRLRAAETNLERLEDVISTLETQQQTLKKQARQATRYRNVNAQIRRSEAIILHLDRESTLTELAEAEEGFQEAEREVAQKVESVGSASTEQAEAASNVPELRQAEAEASAALQRLIVDRDRLEREAAQAEEASTRAQDLITQLETDRARVDRLLKDAETALRRLAEEAEALRAAAEEDEGTVEAAERACEEARGEVERLDGELSTLTEGVAADEAKAAALGRRIEELGRTLERLDGKLEDTRRQQEELGGQQIEPEALSAARKAVDAAEAGVEQAAAAADAAGERLSERQAEERSTRDALHAAEAEAGRISAEIDGLSRLLKPAESDMWPPLIDAVRVPEGLEKAIGAALGDDLDAPADEAAPIHWETLAPYRPDELRPMPGESTPLTEVSAPPALARRLAQVGLVPDEDTGARLQPALLPGQRLVTRDGALWRWDGYTAKADAPTAAAVRLEQRNRLEALRASLAESQRLVADCQATFEEARTAAERTMEEEKAARGRLNAAYTAVDTARREASRTEQAHANVASRLGALEETLAQLQNDRRDTAVSLEAAEEESRHLPDLKAARARVQETRLELSEARTELASRTSVLERLVREREQRAKRQEEIARDRASWQEREQDNRTYLGDLDERLSAARKEHERLSGVPETIAGQREDLEERIEAAEERRRAAADQLAVGETRLKDADRSLKEAEQALASAREERIRAESALSQSRQSLETLESRIREKLECAPDEVLMVAELDPSQDLPPRADVEGKLHRLVRERDAMGPVNLRADVEAEELEAQITGMNDERNDLISAIGRLRQGIGSLNREGRGRLLAAFEHVNTHFSELFVRLFGGGHAHLALTEADDPLEAGLEIMASPPGKRLQVMSLLSGGEQALTALSLLFAVFLTNPAPICVLDEVDAPLDDTNVDRFCTLVDELAHSTSTRFLVITHHRMTMARADRLFGVTMAERGISQLVSVDLAMAESMRETA